MKETRKQIVENTRRKLASQYADKIKYLEERLRNMTKSRDDFWSKVHSLERKNEELELKIKEQDEWIERMQNFVNMSPDQREQELALFRQKQANVEMERRVLDSPLFKIYADLMYSMI